MAGAASRCHTVADGHCHAADAFERQAVEPRDVRLLQLRAPGLVWETPESIDHDEEDFRVVGYRQLAKQFKIHQAILTEVFGSRTSVHSQTALHEHGEFKTVVG